MKRILNFLPIAAIVLTSCATVKEGPQQTVRIETNVRGAACDLTNRRGTWHVGATPATVHIARAASPLQVVCHRGTQLGKETFGSKFQRHSIIGGVAGMSVDVVTGSAYVYPATMKVSLKPVR